MAYTVQLLPSAVSQLASLPKSAQRQIARRTDGLKEDPRPHGVRLLVGEDRIWRLRVGDYRILYQINDAETLVLVIKVGHRREVYRRR